MKKTQLTSDQKSLLMEIMEHPRKRKYLKENEFDPFYIYHYKTMTDDLDVLLDNGYIEWEPEDKYPRINFGRIYEDFCVTMMRDIVEGNEPYDKTEVDGLWESKKEWIEWTKCQTDLERNYPIEGLTLKRIIDDKVEDGQYTTVYERASDKAQIITMYYIDNYNYDSRTI